MGSLDSARTVSEPEPGSKRSFEDEELVRIRLDLAYAGGGFHGWAKQPGLRTVQGEVEAALQTVVRAPVELTVAGRTDAGVHAAHQVAHCDVPASAWAKLLPVTDSPEALAKLRRRFNSLLARGTETPGADVVIHRVQRVGADFDARFCALTRHYQYTLCDRDEALNPTTAHIVWWTGAQGLRLDKMNEAAGLWVGEHDFLSFCKPRVGATTIRTLKTLAVERNAAGEVEVQVSADAFCHSMVRSLVGALVEIGRGRRDTTWARTLVREPARTHGVPIAPAHGLTLVGVDYPPPALWAEQQRKTRRVRTSPCGC
ncbi:tRNA pseudouridine(38-40) synthase TruA [Gleimia hominis]|uniref:tRNA pseudouridine(38-40) synthase TruA n=1 Tax=Gleimia hominis TaxID=595468 RepID=UPI001E59F7D3|nr:tRNA pseudouridine(38-40) synthase TruA [Gleimia hominis]WIK64607.1 tRNA pseudouridine(38-40) synthase TruA [Gleimia hominis]